MIWSWSNLSSPSDQGAWIAVRFVPQSRIFGRGAEWRLKSRLPPPLGRKHLFLIHPSPVCGQMGARKSPWPLVLDGKNSEHLIPSLNTSKGFPLQPRNNSKVHWISGPTDLHPQFSHSSVTCSTPVTWASLPFPEDPQHIPVSGPLLWLFSLACSLTSCRYLIKYHLLTEAYPDHLV